MKKMARVNATPQNFNTPKVIRACVFTVRSMLHIAQRVPPASSYLWAFVLLDAATSAHPHVIAFAETTGLTNAVA